MKKFMLSVLAISLLTACRDEKSSEGSDTSSVSIVGTWKESKTILIDGANNSIISTELPDQCREKSTYQFKSDNQYINIDYVNTNGNCIEDGSENATYNYNAETKTVNMDFPGFDSEVWEALELTEHELQLVLDKYDENEDGVEDKDVLVLYR